MRRARPLELLRHLFPPARDLALAAALTIVALALRLYRLDVLPPGLHFDEAHNGLDAVRILEGARPVFLAGNDGREVLYSYLQAAVVGWRGPTTYALRLTSALLGTLTAPLGYGLARLLGYRRTIATITGLMAAASLWPVALGRFGVRSVMIPLAATAALGLYWHASRWRQSAATDHQTAGLEESAALEADDRTAGPRAHPRSGVARSHSMTRHTGWLAPLGRLGWFAASGLAIGLGAYVHPANLFVPLVVTGFALYRALLDRDQARQQLTGLVVAGLVAVVVFLPMARYVIEHADQVLEHPSRVSVVSEQTDETPLVALAENAAVVAGGLVWRGDRAAFVNLPGRPVLGPLLAPLLLLGLAGLSWTLVRGGRPVAGRPAGTGHRHADREEGVANEPGDREVDIGPASRAASADAAMTNTTSRTSDQRLSEHDRAAPSSTPVGLRRDRAALLLLWLVVMLLPSVLSDDAPHFKRLPGIIPVVYLIPTLALTAVGRWLGRRTRPLLGAGLVVLVVAGSVVAETRAYFVDYAAHPDLPGTFYIETVEKGRTLREIAAGQTTLATPILMRQSIVAFHTLDVPIRTFEMREGLLRPPGDVRYALDPVEADVVAAFDDRWGRWMQRRDWPGPGGRTMLSVFALPAATEIAPPHRQKARFGDAVELVGYRLPAAIGPGEPAELWLHWRMLGPLSSRNKAFVHLLDAAGNSIGQHDKRPLGGTYPAPAWRPGERVIERFTPTVAADAPPGDYTVRVGWYDPETGARLPAVDAAGRPLPAAAVVLETPLRVRADGR